MGEDGPYYDLAEQDAEITSLLVELAALQAEHDSVVLGWQNHDRTQKAELAEAKARIAELEDDVAHLCGQMAGKIREGVTKDDRIAELEAALEHNNSALDGANTIIEKLEIERWKRCPSTHCERRGECASPHECIVKPKPPELKPAELAERDTWRNIAESHEPATSLRQAEFARMDSEIGRLRAELAAKDARISSSNGMYTAVQLERAAQEVARQRDMLKWDDLGDFDRRAYTESARRILDAAFPNPRSQG